MTREIKFRAWNIEDKIMLMEAQDMYDGLGTYYDNKGNEVDVYQYFNSSSFGGILDDAKESTHAVMQSTGLKDKNGKEIYEGDIIKIISKNRKWEGIKIVEWDAPRAMFTPSQIRYADVTATEIIGNIYQNPELMPKRS